MGIKKEESHAIYLPAAWRDESNYVRSRGGGVGNNGKKFKKEGGAKKSHHYTDKRQNPISIAGRRDEYEVEASVLS